MINDDIMIKLWSDSVMFLLIKNTTPANIKRAVGESLLEFSFKHDLTFTDQIFSSSVLTLN